MRQCSNPTCRVPINACMGFVKAGDLLEFQAGKRKPTEVRELCGKCAMLAYRDETPEGQQKFFAFVGWFEPSSDETTAS